MRRTIRGTAVLSLALVLACASKFQSEFYFDHGVDFAPPKALAFLGDGGGEPAHRAIAERELRRALAAKGYRITERKDADMLLRFSLGERSKVRLSGRSTEGRYAGLILELEDPASGKQLWHGLAYTSWFDSMDPEAEIVRAVQEVLIQLPPLAPS